MIYFTAHTFKCVCHCRRAMFRVLGMYNFGVRFDVFVWANSNITTVLFFDSRLSTPHGQGNTLEQLKRSLEQITDYGSMAKSLILCSPKIISQTQIDTPLK